MTNYYVTSVRADGLPVRYFGLSHDKAHFLFNEMQISGAFYVQIGCDTDDEPLNRYAKDAEFGTVGTCNRCGLNRVIAK